MKRSSFKFLEAWRAARALVRPVYELTKRFPDEEKFVLVPQMRRAVHSVHSNIAEGTGRLSNKEWQQFLGHSRGSLMELESAVMSAFDLHYCTQSEAEQLTAAIQRVAQLVNGLLRASRRDFVSKKYG